MSAVESEGPFRAPSLTSEALRAKEHAASLERVALRCEAALAEERRREARLDAFSFAVVAATLVGTGVTLTLSLLDSRGPWLSLSCLAGSLFLSAALALFHRSRTRHRRAARPLRAR